MSVSDPMVTPLALTLVACLEQEIARVTEPPAVTCLRPGDRVELLIAQNTDECCEGLAWVRQVTMYPSRDFPAPDQTYQPCSPVQWAVVMELGAARCAPTTSVTTIPSCAEWTATTMAVYDDQAALRRAMLCFAALDDYQDHQWVWGVWTPMTTEGGCVGGSWQVTIAVPACDTLD